MACTGATSGFTVLCAGLIFGRNNDVRVYQGAERCVMEKPVSRLKGSVDDIQDALIVKCSLLLSITGKSQLYVQSGVACQQNCRARTEFCLQVRNGH